ncbi:MAG: CBS domain-containing protein [Chitinispirillaceae bacterium]|nr:CBS domain-containing protein [Chitinispirillaceae bacterium]
MKAKDILAKKGSETYSIGKSNLVNDAVVMMAREKIGCLLVIEKGKLIGILSERDVITTLAKCLGPKQCDIPIGEVMTTDVVSGGLEDDIIVLMDKMRENRIRHLPIVSGETIEGIISMRDVVRALLDETTFEKQRLVEYVTNRYPQ